MADKHHRQGTITRAVLLSPPNASENVPSPLEPVAPPDDAAGEPVAFRKMALTEDESAIFQRWYATAIPHPIETAPIPLERTDSGAGSRR